MNKVPDKKTVIIIGSGPAGLMAAWQLSNHCIVHLFDRNHSPGHKFLLAGKGGLNITNSLPLDKFIDQYTPIAFIEHALREFTPRDLCNWLLELGIPTFTGTSGKIFTDKNISPSKVLKTIFNSLTERGVFYHPGHVFVDYDNHSFIFDTEEGRKEMQADIAVLALGGASWPQTGSKGDWTEILNQHGISTVPFQASNCGININWPEHIKQFHEGKALKNIAITAGSKTIKGEASITAYGLEGNAVYPLIPEIRKCLHENQTCHILIDLKPDNTIQSIEEKLSNCINKPSVYAEKLRLSSTQQSIIKAYTLKEENFSREGFAKCIKNVCIPVLSLRPIEEAISTAGGVSLQEMNQDMSLKRYPHIFVIGEMCDWDAPTGGFLLQACFSTAFLAAQSIKSIVI